MLPTHRSFSRVTSSPSHSARAQSRLGRSLALWLVACGVASCAHNAQRTHDRGAPAFIDDALLPPAADAAAQLAALHTGDVLARAVRLDRLLDLFDAARFGNDAAARERLWEALGGHGSGVGAAATAEATGRLLAEALAIEDAAETNGFAAPDALQFVRDAIMLLANDLAQPVTADDLSIRLAAYRDLVQRGHPRIADNARWRQYDHVRGTLEGALAATPAKRMQVAVHTLYVERDSVSEYLQTSDPRARPPYPTSAELWARLQTPTTALAALPRWRAVLARRDAPDAKLHAALSASLPAVRESSWVLPQWPSGTGREESLAPVVVASGERFHVDAGRPGARVVDAAAPNTQLIDALRTALVRDGRGTLLFAIDPSLAAPLLHRLLAASRSAGVARIELAGREARLRGDGHAVVALPIEIVASAARTARRGTGTAALTSARLGAALDGHGVEFSVDRLAVRAPAGGTRTPSAAEQLQRAYPRERSLWLTVGADAAVAQLDELVVALVGGPRPRFAAIGWLEAPPAPVRSPGDSDAIDLAARLAWAWPSPTADIVAPYALRPADQTRLQKYADRLPLCLPELGGALAPRSSFDVILRFEAGKLAAVTSVGGPQQRRRAEPFVNCALDEGLGVRLVEHHETLTVTVTLQPR